MLTVEGLKRAGWVARATRDMLGRQIHWYYAAGPQGDVPLVLWIQGSGHQPLFHEAEDGRVFGGYHNLLRQAARSELRTIVVEKPGASNSRSGHLSGGTAFGASEVFRAEHTLERWLEALRAALFAAVQELAPGVRPLAVTGHSEGAVVAAALAPRVPAVTHLGLLGCRGMTGFGERYLEETLGLTRQQAPAPEESLQDESRTQDVAGLVSEILADPTNTERFAWGHPFPYWAGFGRLSPAEVLHESDCELFLAHGERDEKVPLSSFAALVGAGWAAGKKPNVQLVRGADHGFRQEGQSGPEGMRDVLRQLVAWIYPSILVK